MPHKRIWGAFVGTGAALALAGAVTPAQAQDLGELREQLKVLNEEVERLEADKAAGVKFAPGKLQIESADGDFSIRLGGRLQIDGAVFDEDQYTTTPGNHPGAGAQQAACRWCQDRKVAAGEKHVEGRPLQNGHHHVLHDRPDLLRSRLHQTGLGAACHCQILPDHRVNRSFVSKNGKSG